MIRQYLPIPKELPPPMVATLPLMPRLALILKYLLFSEGPL